MNAVSSLRRRILGILLVITTVFSIFPATSVGAAGEQPLDVDFYAATYFQNDLSLVYYCKINTPGDYKNLRLDVSFQKFSGASDSYTWENRVITEYTYDTEKGMYRFMFRGINATEMGSTLKTTLKTEIGNQTYASSEKQFSIKQYAKQLLESKMGSTDKIDKLLCTLLVDMLNYGSAAQNYFGFHTGSLANSDLTSAQKALASEPMTSLTSSHSETPISGAEITFKGIALECDSTIDLVTYVDIPQAPEKSVYAEISYDSFDGYPIVQRVYASDFVYDTYYKLYRVEFTGVSALYFRTPMTLVFRDGDRQISSTMTYSYETYIREILNSSQATQPMKTVATNLMNYCNSAINYYKGLGSSGTGPVGPTTYVTYSMFKEPGDPDDYMSLVRAHEYANEHNLPVKADEGATYVINHMDPSNPKGALIMTDTDWTGATFEIHDDLMTLDAGDRSSEGDCYLFTVEPSQSSYKKYMNDGFGIYMGLDPRLSQYPEYQANIPSSYPDVARQLQFKNTEFSSSTTQLDMRPGENFPQRTLFILETYSKRRWGRFGSSAASDTAGKPQKEIIIVNQDGSIDSSTPIQWDWFNINMVEAYPIDETPLTIKGGTFNTYVNTLASEHYVKRGISITRSNVTMDGTKHYLKGELATFAVTLEKNGVIRPRLGSPIQGFFRIDHCINVTLTNCVFSNHLVAFVYKNNTDNSSPYDYYAEFAANLVIDHCVCAGDGDDPSGKGDPTGILDETRWGTTGTNYCKGITVTYSSLNRVDAHKGTYNLTVKNSTLGCKSVAAVGFGTMYLENVRVTGSKYFIHLRNDYGSAWFGDIIIRNCTWELGTNYTCDLIQAIYNPLNEYLYEPILVENADGTTTRYYSSLPTRIDIDGLTVDASEIVHLINSKGGIDDGPARQLYNQRGFNIYTSILTNSGGAFIDDTWLSNPANNPRPLKVTEEVKIRNLKFIKAPEYADWTLKYVAVRNGEYPQIKDAYLHHTTVLDWDGEIDYSVAGETSETGE